jgi:hypothetical protein
MDELFMHALETGSSDHLTNDQKDEYFQALLDEWKRLHGWVARCLGTEISNWGGPQVDPPAGD